MSGRKNVILPFHLVNAVSMTASSTSSVFTIQYLDNVGIEIVWTGTPVGTFTIEGSISGVTYQALDFGTALTAAGSASNLLLNINQCPYTYLRVKYVAGSSTGTLNVYITAKEI